MNNCLLCSNCKNETESIDGYPTKPFYTCDIRELDNDNRFPYKNTSCKQFIPDRDLISLYVKDVSQELFNTITWNLYE